MLHPMFNLFYLLLLLSAAAMTTALTHPSDVKALKAFKSSINPTSIPSSWSCLSSWDFSVDPCALPRRTHFLCGLSCDPSGHRVTSLTLDSVGYSGTLTPLLSLLSELTTLDLTDNSFHGPIPFTSLSSLRRLRSLSLAGNSFSGPLSPSLSSLKSLESLDLSRNSLSGPIPDSIWSLTSLQRLDLSLNRLTGPIPNLPPNLLELTIRSNSLSGPILLTAFSNSARLVVLDLTANSLSGPLPSWIFTHLTSLQQLNLSNNTLTRVNIPVPTRTFGGSLVAVDLGFNRLNGYVPVNFASYPSLAALSLRHNRLRGRVPWQYGKQRSLTRLFLDGNYLIGKPPTEFFSGKGGVSSGSLGDNCLRWCPPSSELCLPLQKPLGLCNKVYKHRS